MEIETDDLAGVTVRVSFDDDLADVPASHRHLLTDDIRAVFDDPHSFLERVRDGSQVPNMREWFQRILDDGTGYLTLEVGDPADVMTRAGLFFAADGIRPAIVGPPQPFAESLYPPGMATFYRTVGFVDWMGLMFAGKLDSPDATETPRSTLDYLGYTGGVVPAETTRLVGGSYCGDMMICTADGRGGWWCHETHHVHLLGTDLALIDWVFGELLVDRPPNYDHAWAA